MNTVECDGKPNAQLAKHPRGQGEGGAQPAPLARLAAGAALAGAAGHALAQATLSAADASRFLSQAGFGGNDVEIANVQKLGAAAWLQQQFAAPSDSNNWNWMVAQGLNTASLIDKADDGIDASMWRKLMYSPDILRQRVVLALSELFVISLQGLPVPWHAFGAAAYMDMLAANAFGNYRTLLGAVTLNPAMGVYLGTRGNQKEDPRTGRQADENYGREVMQLFSIGLYQLEVDGTLKLSKGLPIETYTLDTVTNIARVFTGWNFDRPSATAPDHMQRPMVLDPALHSSAAKSFLGVSLPAGGDGKAELKTALDTLFMHPNVPPFIGKQLIQRLVCSNPSPAYVRRVAQAFISGDGGVRGDMKSVIRAILLDAEARPDTRSLTPTSGKLREPIVRLAQWARTYRAISRSGAWAVGDTSNAGVRLAQSPLRSPTVFNFFRPGYVPPNGVLGSPTLLAPELQITNESSVVAYANYMQNVIDGRLADLSPNYDAEMALAGNPAALVDRLNTQLAGGLISAPNAAIISNAIATIGAAAYADRLSRVKAAIMLVMCAPEYLVQK